MKPLSQSIVVILPASSRNSESSTFCQHLSMLCITEKIVHWNAVVRWRARSQTKWKTEICWGMPPRWASVGDKRCHFQQFFAPHRVLRIASSRCVLERHCDTASLLFWFHLLFLPCRFHLSRWRLEIAAKSLFLLRGTFWFYDIPGSRFDEQKCYWHRYREGLKQEIWGLKTWKVTGSEEMKIFEYLIEPSTLSAKRDSKSDLCMH